MIYINKKTGFTLVELLVVISIISLLSSVILSSVSDARSKSKDSYRVRSLLELRNALLLYYHDNGFYPASSSPALSTSLSPYIKAINPEIYYNGTQSINGQGSACTVSNNTCLGFHLGITLDKKNTILNSDKDLETAGVLPDGLSTLPSCGNDPSATIATDLCFDIVQ